MCFAERPGCGVEPLLPCGLLTHLLRKWTAEKWEGLVVRPFLFVDPAVGLALSGGAAAEKFLRLCGEAYLHRKLGGTAAKN